MLLTTIIISTIWIVWEPRVPVIGPYHLTMTAEEGAAASLAFRNAAIVPIHFEDWAHFSDGPDDIARAFEAAGVEQRLQWPERSRAIQIDLVSNS